MCDVAVCQFTSTNNKQENLDVVIKLVKLAAEKGAKVAFLPEACDFIGTDHNETQNLSEPLNGPTVQSYQKLAQETGIWISVGGFHERDSDSRMNNTHLVINAAGKIVAVYRKLHLFDVSIPEKNLDFSESKCVRKGMDIVKPVETPAGPLGPLICYDLRFPELGIIQRKNGAAILSYPSAFTNYTGTAHWEILLRSRAIENQCYVVAAAQYGRHNEKRTSYGNSMIIDPWGKILAQCPAYSEDLPNGESIAYAKIDLKFLDDIRMEMPVFNHRRDDIYQLQEVGKNGLPILESDVFKFSHINIPADTVFYKTKNCYAFTNLRCVVPGHVLVSPMRAALRLEHLSNEEVSELFQTVQLVVKIMEKAMSATSSTICVQDGKDAGQTIKHVHVHILPRKSNDFENNDDIYEQLAKHDRDLNQKPRELSEMIAEAKFLKKYFYSS